MIKLNEIFYFLLTKKFIDFFYACFLLSTSYVSFLRPLPELTIKIIIIIFILPHEHHTLSYCKLMSPIKVKLVTLVEGDPKAPFSIPTTSRCRRGLYSIPWIAPLYPYLIILSIQQGGMQHHFLSLWYDSTWNWFLVSRIISEHSTQTE